MSKYRLAEKLPNGEIIPFGKSYNSYAIAHGVRMLLHGGKYIIVTV